MAGPVSVNYSELLGHALPAEMYIAALVGSRGNFHPTFIACLPTDDLHAAVVAMHKVEAEYLVVLRNDVNSTLTADVVGVVTHGDITANFSMKSRLMSRDRTRSRPVTKWGLNG